MEEEKIKTLFDGFEPPLESDHVFLLDLENKLDAVDMVRSKIIKEKRHNRMAVVVAACAGFIVGFLFSGFLPWIRNAMECLAAAVPESAMLQIMGDHCLVLSWIAIGGAALFTSLNVYELSLSFMKRR